MLLLTDSLGMPRENIPLEKTWVYKVIKKFGTKNIIFTFSRRGLTSDEIKNNSKDIFVYYNPDIVIAQFGIVDCTRRVLPKRLRFIARGYIRKFIQKYHYAITKLYTLRYVSHNKFKENILLFNNLAAQQGTTIIYIKISPPGEYLKKKVFKIEDDVRTYNELIISSSKNFKNVIVIDPYKNHKPEEFLLDDGHHLNEFGHELVFNSIKNFLQTLQ